MKNSIDRFSGQLIDAAKSNHTTLGQEYMGRLASGGGKRVTCSRHGQTCAPKIWNDAQSSTKLADYFLAGFAAQSAAVKTWLVIGRLVLYSEN